MEKIESANTSNEWITTVTFLSYVENGGLKLVLYVARPFTCMTVAFNSIILTAMCYTPIFDFLNPLCPD